MGGHHLEIERRFLPAKPLVDFPKGTKVSRIYQSHLGDSHSLNDLVNQILSKVETKISEEENTKKLQARIKRIHKKILKAFTGEKVRGGKYKLRVRIEKTQKGVQSLLTCKRKVSRKNSKLAVYKEFDTKISEKEARFLATLDGVVGVRKIRYRIPTKGGRIWEYNQHLGVNHGVNTVDVELPKRKSKAGKSPLGKVKEMSVTEQKSHSAKALQIKTQEAYKITGF